MCANVAVRPARNGAGRGSEMACLAQFLPLLFSSQAVHGAFHARRGTFFRLHEALSRPSGLLQKIEFVFVEMCYNMGRSATTGKLLDWRG